MIIEIEISQEEFAAIRRVAQARLPFCFTKDGQTALKVAERVVGPQRKGGGK